IGAHPGRARLPHHRPLADARRPARRPQCRPARRPPGLTGRTLSPTVRARIGIDTGGTFTDLVLLDEAGRAVRLKVPSTPADPARALIDGVSQVVGLAGGAVPAAVAHGTTVATNAMLEERFHTLALVTTRGFRHVLE